MIEKKQLFTGITEEESATVCGGAVYDSGSGIAYDGNGIGSFALYNGRAFVYVDLSNLSAIQAFLAQNPGLEAKLKQLDK